LSSLDDDDDGVGDTAYGSTLAGSSSSLGAGGRLGAGCRLGAGGGDEETSSSSSISSSAGGGGRTEAASSSSRRAARLARAESDAVRVDVVPSASSSSDLVIHPSKPSVPYTTATTTTMTNKTTNPSVFAHDHPVLPLAARRSGEPPPRSASSNNASRSVPRRPSSAAFRSRSRLCVYLVATLAYRCECLNDPSDDIDGGPAPLIGCRQHPFKSFSACSTRVVQAETTARVRSSEWK
jgi:hypothetical protein